MCRCQDVSASARLLAGQEEERERGTEEDLRRFFSGPRGAATQHGVFFPSELFIPDRLLKSTSLRFFFSLSSGFSCFLPLFLSEFPCLLNYIEKTAALCLLKNRPPKDESILVGIFEKHCCLPSINQAFRFSLRRRSINQSLLTLGRVITALREVRKGLKGGCNEVENRRKEMKQVGLLRCDFVFLSLCL